MIERSATARKPANNAQAISFPLSLREGWLKMRVPRHNRPARSTLPASSKEEITPNKCGQWAGWQQLKVQMSSVLAIR
jgi:hypothetical protein